MHATCGGTPHLYCMGPGRLRTGADPEHRHTCLVKAGPLCSPLALVPVLHEDLIDHRRRDARGWLLPVHQRCRHRMRCERRDCDNARCACHVCMVYLTKAKYSAHKPTTSVTRGQTCWFCVACRVYNAAVACMLASFWRPEREMMFGKRLCSPASASACALSGIPQSSLGAFGMHVVRNASQSRILMTLIFLCTCCTSAG